MLSEEKVAEVKRQLEALKPQAISGEINRAWAEMFAVLDGGLQNWENDLREDVRKWAWEQDGGARKTWGQLFTEVVIPRVGNVPLLGLGEQHGRLLDILSLVSKGIYDWDRERNAEFERRRRARI